MKKTNYLQKTMMLFGTSLLVLTAFTSCSEKEEIFIPKEGIETKGTEGETGCRGIIGGGYVNPGGWNFIDYVEIPAPAPSPNAPDRMSSGKITFYVKFPKSAGPTNYTLTVRTLVNNTTITEYENVFIGSRCIPGSGVEMTWYDKACRTVKVVVFGPYTTAPVGIYVTY